MTMLKVDKGFVELCRICLIFKESNNTDFSSQFPQPYTVLILICSLGIENYQNIANR